jgi:hypothetical protein
VMTSLTQNQFSGRSFIVKQRIAEFSRQNFDAAGHIGRGVLLIN